jgi:hypothetical protein
MRIVLKLIWVLLLGIGFCTTTTLAQTDGGARMEVTLLDYNGAGTAHYTVAWIANEAGTFIKTLRKQGPSSFTSSQWGSHCSTWNTARAGSTALDGYTGATASNYSGTNSPVILTWNCRDASNTLVPDGNYKFWVQYAEDNGQGPFTTGGLLWTKGPAASTNTYLDQGANFSKMKVTWTPAITSVPPTITSAAPTTTGTVGTTYSFTCTATGTAPITFTATGLPTGLAISTAGVISGTPTAAGTFNGTITAANGTSPNATQAFSIVIGAGTVSITSVQIQGSSVVLGGTGPANGTYQVLSSTSVTLPMSAWTSIATNSIGSSGTFSFTAPITAGVSQSFYQLRLP